jgi:iron complex outermembrane receptor protein
MLRASYGTGFVPPTVMQLAPNALGNTSGGATDPRRGNTALGAYQTLSGGNPALKPEHSKSWGGGVVLTPHWLPDFRLSVDYTRIKKTDNIATTFPGSTQGLINLESVFPDRIIRGPNLPGDQPGWAGPITLVNLTAFNLSKADVEAYDVQADYTKKTESLGAFDFFGVATWETHYRTQVIDSQPVVENVGLGNTIAGSPLKFKGNAGVTWRKGPWSAGWTSRYLDSYFVFVSAVAATNAPFLQAQGNGGRVRPQDYHDVFVGYRFGPAAGAPKPARLLANIEIQAGVKNVFNTRPPLDVSNTFSLYSYYGDPRLSVYWISLKKSF